MPTKDAHGIVMINRQCIVAKFHVEGGEQLHDWYPTIARKVDRMNYWLKNDKAAPGYDQIKQNMNSAIQR